MRVLLPLLLSVMLIHAEGILKHITLGDNDYSIVTEDYDVYDSKGTVVKFYYEARNNDLIHQFSFTLHDKTGTCSARSIEDGTYEIEGKTITLYSFYDRQGRIYDVPYGAKITTYVAQKDGSLKKTQSRFYIETAKKSFDKESGMRFLWKKPASKEEKKAFDDYIHDVEQRYKGTFVTGEEAKVLMNEVKEALHRKMMKRWQ